MKRNKNFLLIFILFILVSSLFFYKLFIFQKIPFPGDLLISEYGPWKNYSFLGYNPGTYPNKGQYFDTIRQIYPWKTISVAVLKNFQIPFWNPYNFSGAPLLANFQSSVFYPFNIFYFLLPQEISWSLLIILQVILSSIFTYLFLKEIGVSTMGAFLASIAFSYSLFTTVFLEYNIIIQTILWLPLTLYLFEIFLRKKNYFTNILLALSIVCSLLAGHIQIFSFSLVFIFLYMFFRIISSKKEEKLRDILFYSVLIILSLGLGFFQILPTLELISNSARSFQELGFLKDKLLIQPSQLILFLSPDFFGNPATRNYLLSDSYPGNALYIGIFPLVFAAIGILNLRKISFVKYFSVFSLVLLFFLTRNPLSEIFYSVKIPFFSTGSPNNAIFLLSFSLAIVSGFGFDYFIAKKEKRNLLPLIFFLFIFLAIWIAVLFFHIQISNKNFIFSTVILFLAFGIFFINFIFKKSKILPILIIIITVFDLFYFFQKFNSFVPKSLVFPSVKVIDFIKENGKIDRFWGYGSANIEANFATQYSIFSPDGYDPLYPKRYGEFIQSSKNGKIVDSFTNQTRSDAVILPGYGETDLAENRYRLKVMDVLGVKYVLDGAGNPSSEKTFPVDRFKIVFENNGWRVFENLKASPRIFLSSNYKLFNNKEDFEKIFFSSDFDPSKTILLEENPPAGLENSSLNKIKIISYTPNKIILDVENNSNQLLFISDTYYPGWKAFVGGSETKIYRADYAFRSVYVPKGKHQISFIYYPNLFKLGIYISVLSFFAILFEIFIFNKIKKS